jgi:hypothetical protein
MAEEVPHVALQQSVDCVATVHVPPSALPHLPALGSGFEQQSPEVQLKVLLQMQPFGLPVVLLQALA